jgi:hypothetical protein
MVTDKYFAIWVKRLLGRAVFFRFKWGKIQWNVWDWGVEGGDHLEYFGSNSLCRNFVREAEGNLWSHRKPYYIRTVVGRGGMLHVRRHEFFSRLLARGVEVGAMYPLQIWVHPLAICKISETNTLISATPYRIHPSPLLNRRGWKKISVKHVCIGRVVCAVL